MYKSERISVIIADTAFIIRKGLRTLVQENSAFEYITEVADSESLHVALKQHHPNVLIVDHCCDDCFSLNVIREIKKEYPDINILVISHEKTAEEIKKIIGIGIKNYLLKDCDEQEITDAITCCAKGVKYFCGQIIDVLLEKEISVKEHCATGGITERESEIIKQFVSGKRSKEIAALLHISPFTVNTHKKNIYKKLGITNNYELAQYAIKTGLLK
ncbi:MAG: response regulator transcription factor [Bacteroidia bacterium]|nr:response regulator transcription factor [Bacteroidia bacterium]